MPHGRAAILTAVAVITVAPSGCPGSQGPPARAATETAFSCDGEFKVVEADTNVRNAANVVVELTTVGAGNGRGRVFQILRLGNPFIAGSVTVGDTQYTVMPSGCAATASAAGTPTASQATDPADATATLTVVNENYDIQCDPHKQSTITFGYSRVANNAVSAISVTPNTVKCTNGNSMRVSESVTFTQSSRDIFSPDRTSIELVDSQGNTCDLSVPFPLIVSTPNPLSTPRM